MDFVTSALLVSWVAIALLALVVSGLVRQVHQLSRGGVTRAPGRLGVTPGSRAPHAGEVLAEGRETLLLFLSPDCRTCAEVLTEAERLDERPSTDVPQVRVVYADAAPTTAPTIPVFDHRPDLFTAFDAIATPFAVVVDATGRVARSEPLGSPAALRELLADSPSSQPRSVS